MSDPTPPPPSKKATKCGVPLSCDYLVIGGGATGMAFCDTLLNYTTNTELSVVLVDPHDAPGGQWHDSYAFVRLHQPSRGYGVESVPLEPSSNSDSTATTTITTTKDDDHLATRQEILEYYQQVREQLETKYDFVFVGGVTFDMSQLQQHATSTASDDNNIKHKTYQLDETTTIQVRQKVVDARYLQPDLPVFLPPKFDYDADQINCIPVNDLVVPKNTTTTTTTTTTNESSYFVVLGGGKTGMDAVAYLLQQKSVPPDHILWVRPNEAWITARERIGTCMEFLHDCCVLAQAQQHNNNNENTNNYLLLDAVTSPEFFQNGFLQWEQEGKVYRLDPTATVLPTKFKDATLSKDELQLLQTVTHVVSQQGRVQRIDANGTLHLLNHNHNNTTTTAVPLPSTWSLAQTTFVHCTAGAFNYSQHLHDTPPPVFAPHLITIQDVYGTPGFCFVGSLIGRLESLPSLHNADKNRMCLAPRPDPVQAQLPLGPSGGNVGTLSPHHGLVQRLSNLRHWLAIPELAAWLEGHRLFHLGHQTTVQLQTLVNETWDVLVQANMVVME